MATVSERPVQRKVAVNGAQHTAEIIAAAERAPTLDWGDSGPIALLALGVTTFMLSMVNANAVAAGVTPMLFGVALMFGGITQTIAGIIQLRTGKTFAGAMFLGFGGFYLSLFAIGQWFLKDIPPSLTGHALGLFLYGFAFFAVVMWAASFRTTAVVVLTLTLTVVLVLLLAAGNYGANATMIHWGGYLGLAAAGCIFYMALAELCETTYGRVVLPVWPLAKH